MGEESEAESPFFPFDRTLKKLFGAFFADFAHSLGISPESVEEVNVELATVGRLVDRAWRVRDPVEHLVLIEFQSSPNPKLLLRLNLYIALLAEKYELPVRAIVFLLRPGADTAEMTGEWSFGLPGQPPWQQLRYELVRIHEIPVETLLTSGLGLLPLAPVAAGAEDKLDSVCHTVIRRIQEEAPPELVENLLVATYLLMGLRYKGDVIRSVFKGVLWMKDSVTYQEIIREGFDSGVIQGREEGREEGRKGALQETLLDIGGWRIGNPSSEVVERIQAENRMDVLKKWIKRASESDSWDAVFAE